MKKFILLALLAVGSAKGIIAQTIGIAHDTVTSWAGVGAVDIHNTVINQTSGAIDVSWQVIDSSMSPNVTLAGICDNINCYTWTGVNGLSHGLTQSTTIAGNGTMDLKISSIDATNASVPSTTWFTIKIWDSNNPSSTKNATYILKRVPTAVPTVVKGDDNVMLYPNPARSDLNVIFDANAGIKNISIYNLIGKPVSVFRVVGNSAKLNLDNVPSGIYFVRLIDAQGKIVSTRKFTHQ
jgi:hypothetical protein